MTHLDAPRSARFDSAFGPCGIAWSSSGVTRVQLPGDPGIDALPSVPADAPAFLPAAVAAIADALAGRPADLASVPLDLATLPPFTRRVLDAARRIPAGRTETYGSLAAQVRHPLAARAVGQAMARNPVPLLVPCHRVVAVSGALCGFSAPGGLATKRRLLALEAAASTGS